MLLCTRVNRPKRVRSDVVFDYFTRSASTERVEEWQTYLELVRQSLVAYRWLVDTALIMERQHDAGRIDGDRCSGQYLGLQRTN